MRPADAANLRRLALGLIKYVIIKFVAGWISDCFFSVNFPVPVS